METLRDAVGQVLSALRSAFDFVALHQFIRQEAAKSGHKPHLWVVAALSVLYCLYKLALFYPLPQLRNRKLPRSLKGAVIAHRGSREEGLPENTIAAFKDAVAAGADIVELDVWLTKDGKIVVHHDESLARMTMDSCKDKIHQVDYAALPKIVPLTPQDGRVKSIPFERRAEWENIPLLEEVLAVLPENVALIVEFKQDSNELISKVHDLILSLDKSGSRRKENMYWFSLIESINAKLRAKDASIPTIISATSVLKVLLYYYIGLLPFVKLPDAVFGITVEEITLDRVRHEKALKDVPDVLKRLLAYLLSGKPSGVMVSPGCFAHLRKRGIPVWFLGCNTEEDIKVAIKAGATAVLTDRVNWLCNLVKKHGLCFHAIKERAIAADEGDQIFEKNKEG